MSSPPETPQPDAAAPFNAAIGAVRKRADATAKAIGGLGTTAVTAVGIAKFSDVFPWPPGQGLALAGLLVGFLTMAFVVACFTARLWWVNSPVVIKSDVDAMSDLDAGEKALVRPVYEEVATLNGAASLEAYEARQFRLQRVALRAGDDLRAKLEQKAAEISTDIGTAQARAGLLIVRRRAMHAVANGTAGALFALFALGVIGFGVSADRLDSERDGRIKTAKACVDAAAAKKLLPPICGSVEAAAAKEPTAAEKLSTAIESLGTALGKCEAARASSTGKDPCAAVLKALAGP